jgi:hypothetical protein
VVQIVTYTKQSKWIELKKEMFADMPLCKLCKVRPAIHLHHAVINKGKVRNKKFHKFLDVRENALEVCEPCHKMADAYGVRKTAYQLNAQRYGEEHMREWLDGLPLKIKERFE